MHPDPSQLEAFAAGRLTNADEQSISTHLQECAHCVGLVEELSQDQTIAPEGESSDVPASTIVRAFEPIKPVEPITSVVPTTTAISQSGDSAKIGRYQIIRSLGEGAFGAVYLAKDPLLSREVAIKIPHRKGWSENQLEAFAKEAKSLGQLNHPNVINVYDTGVDNGVPFIAMEYVDGCPLSGMKITDGSLLRTVLGGIAAGLAHAHSKGFIHRDLKPANVLVTSDGQAKISDFGLAIDDSSVLKEQIAGTLPYMSPEQIQGDVAKMDGRSDIWSFGVMLYELLAGRRPFQGKTRQEIAEQVLLKDVKPPSQFNNSVDRKLEALCQKCLQRKIADRPANALELVDVMHPPSRSSWYGKVAVLVAAVALLASIAVALKGDPAEPYQLKPISWSGHSPDQWYKDADNESPLTIFCPANLACFQMYERCSDDFEVKIEASLLSEYGRAGVVLGLQKTSASPDKYSCLAIYIGQIPYVDGIMLNVEEWQIESSRVLSKNTLHSKKTPFSTLKNFAFIVSVANNEVSSVKVDDEVLEFPAYQLPKLGGCGIAATEHVSIPRFEVNR